MCRLWDPTRGSMALRHPVASGPLSLNHGVNVVTHLRTAATFVVVAILSLASLLPGKSSAADTTFFVVRHAERADQTEGTHLSADGTQRAQQLMQTLQHLHIDAIFHTDRIRSKETAQPLAQKLSITPTVYSDPTLTWLNQIVTSQAGKRTLIVAHSDTVHKIVNGLSGKNEPEIGQRFDILYVVVISDNQRSTVRLTYGKTQ